MFRTICIGILLGCTMSAGRAAGSSNLLPNGSFDHPEDPLFGWTRDYRWTGNRHYRNNHDRVEVVAREAGRRQVLSLRTHPQTKVESLPIPYEPGARYRCTLWMKGERGRFYFAGYRPAPGAATADRPSPADLRSVYRSRTVMDSSRNWKRISFEFPTEGIDSPTALRHLESVRFFTVYIWTGDTEAPAGSRLFVDQVEVVRIR